MRFRVWSWEVGVWGAGSGFGVGGLGVRDYVVAALRAVVAERVARCHLQGLGFRVYGLWFMVYGLGVRV